jgi:hypothetical protein
MGGGKNPAERPSKICPVCGKPFNWRKSWRNTWESVIYCSDRCRERRSHKSVVTGHK